MLPQESIDAAREQIERAHQGSQDFSRPLANSKNFNSSQNLPIAPEQHNYLYRSFGRRLESSQAYRELLRETVDQELVGYFPGTCFPVPVGLLNKTHPSSPNEIDLGSPFAPEKETTLKPGYGLPSRSRTGFSRTARTQARRAAAALERKFSIEPCVFVTLTLPGSTRAAIDEFAKWTGWLLNRLNTWLSQNFSYQGSVYRVGVWEWQERGALHYHMLIVVDPERFEEFEKAITQKWLELLDYLSEKTGIDLFQKRENFTWRDKQERIAKVACDVQKVEKSVSAYLSKYISEEDENQELYLRKYLSPSRWSSVPRATKRCLAEQTITISFGVANRHQLDEILAYVNEILAAYGLWKCPLTNPFTNDQMGVIGRGDYDQMIEVAKVIECQIRGTIELYRGSTGWNWSDAEANRWRSIWERVARFSAARQAEDPLSGQWFQEIDSGGVLSPPQCLLPPSPGGQERESPGRV